MATACAHAPSAPPGALDADARIVATDDSSVIAWGRYLAYGPAHCVACHTPEGPLTGLEPGDEPPLIGGYTMRFTGGHVMTPNLTPDAETGIRPRTDFDLVRILRRGVRSDGSTALPIMEYQDLSDDDLRAIVSFLRAQAPVRHEVPERHLNLLGKLGMALFVRPKGPDAQPAWRHPPRRPTVEWGDYLVNRVAACAGCHTKRSGTTGSYKGPRLAGGWTMELDGDSDHAVVTPNLTPDPRTGAITEWDEATFVRRFRKGPLVRGTPMPWSSYARMTDVDLRAVYRYLQSVPPVENDTGPAPRDRDD